MSPRAPQPDPNLLSPEKHINSKWVRVWSLQRGFWQKKNADGAEVGFGIESMHGMRDAENNRRAYGDSAILRAVSLLRENLWADARLLAFTMSSRSLVIRVGSLFYTLWGRTIAFCQRRFMPWTDRRSRVWVVCWLKVEFRLLGSRELSQTPDPFFVAVPQGSILGPLLFVLHVNDLPTVTRNCNTLMYADGTLLVNCITYIYWNIWSTVKTSNFNLNFKITCFYPS